MINNDCLGSFPINGHPEEKSISGADRRWLMPHWPGCENKVNLWIDLTKLLEGRVGQFKDIILALGQLHHWEIRHSLI